MQILRRGGEAPALSKSASDGGDSDSEKNKAPLTREEREQRYEQARLRIMGAAKPEAEAPGLKEKDDSRSSSVAGKKKGKKQRTNSEDGFEARSAFSSYQTPSSYAPPGSGESGGPAAAYYPPYPENGAGPYNAPPNTYTPQTYSAVYGQTMPSQAPYPWLQQGYSGYGEANGPQWNQAQHNGNDLASDFQQAMSFGPANLQGLTNHAAQGGQYNYANPQAPSWSQGPPYQPNYPMAPGYPQFSPSDRPATSASHGSQYGFGMPANHMGGPFVGYNNAAMNGAFQRGSFNPQSQAFIPGYQTSGPQHFMPGMAANNNPGVYNSFGGQHGMQRQSSTQSQASSYGAQRPSNDNNTNNSSNSVNGVNGGNGGNGGGMLRGTNSGMTHPLPQPVFSPNVAMPPFQGAKVQQPTPGRASGGGNVPHDRSPGSSNGTSASTIAKWGTPASLPAKPPPPANDSYDLSRLAGQRGPSFNPAAAARLPGMGGAGYHNMAPMGGMRGGAAAGQNARGGQ